MAYDTSRITQIGAPINLPFFNTPYTYPDAIVGNAGLAMTASGGDFAAVANGNTNNNTSSLTESNINTATVSVFTQTKLQRMTLNGGFNPTMFPSTNNSIDPGIVVDGSWWWPDIDQYTSPPFSRFTAQVRIGNAPFKDGKNTTSAPTDNRNTPIDNNITNAGAAQFTTTFGSNLGRLCVKVVANIGFSQVDLGINLRGYVACPGRGIDVAICAFYPPLNGFQQIIDLNGGDLFRLSQRFFIPDYRNRTNYFWYQGINGTPVIVYRRVDANIDALSGGMAILPSATLYQLVTSSASFNAHLLANQVFPYSVANGLILADATAGIDYFMQSDGSTMYPLNYINYGTVKAVPVSQTITGNYALAIDSSGVAYYTGNTAVVGGVLQPLFSVGFNIPFNPVILPQIPPIPFPCWDPCLGRVGGAPGQLNMSNTQNN